MDENGSNCSVIYMTAMAIALAHISMPISLNTAEDLSFVTIPRGVFAYTQITQTVTHKFEEKNKNNKK